MNETVVFQSKDELALAQNKRKGLLHLRLLSSLTVSVIHSWPIVASGVICIPTSSPSRILVDMPVVYPGVIGLDQEIADM